MQQRILVSARQCGDGYVPNAIIQLTYVLTLYGVVLEGTIPLRCSMSVKLYLTYKLIV